jgi:hypothetical protein
MQADAGAEASARAKEFEGPTVCGFGCLRAVSALSPTLTDSDTQGQGQSYGGRRHETLALAPCTSPRLCAGGVANKPHRAQDLAAVGDGVSALQRLGGVAGAVVVAAREQWWLWRMEDGASAAEAGGSDGDFDLVRWISVRVQPQGADAEHRQASREWHRGGDGDELTALSDTQTPLTPLL